MSEQIAKIAWDMCQARCAEQGLARLDWKDQPDWLKEHWIVNAWQAYEDEHDLLPNKQADLA